MKQLKPKFTDLYKTWSMKEKYSFYGINKIGYLDIETSGLTADFDIILSWAILTRDIKTGKTHTVYDFVTKKDFDLAHRAADANIIDKSICESLVKEMVKCDCLIGHWFVGKHRHDMPFIRTRLAINCVPGLPKHKLMRYGDTQKWASLLYRLHSNGLDSVANMFNVHTHKTRLEPRVWQNACIGIKDDVKYVLNHNIKDCRITYEIHKGMEDYVPIPNTFA